MEEQQHIFTRWRNIRRKFLPQKLAVKWIDRVSQYAIISPSTLQGQTNEYIK